MTLSLADVFMLERLRAQKRVTLPELTYLWGLRKRVKGEEAAAVAEVLSLTTARPTSRAMRMASIEE